MTARATLSKLVMFVFAVGVIESLNFVFTLVTLGAEKAPTETMEDLSVRLGLAVLNTVMCYWLLTHLEKDEHKKVIRK